MYGTIQVSRAIAAILVVLFHLGGTIALDKYFALPEFARLFSFGHAGVDFFFVLSGFIIAYAHWGDIGEVARLGPYLRKRIVRIYPIYWIIFIAVFVGALLYPGLRDSVPSDGWLLLKSLLLLPLDKAVVGGTGHPVLIVAWSLQYEVLFYAVMATFIASKRLGYVIAALLLVVSVAYWKSEEFPFSFVGNEWLYLFAMGAGIAAFCRYGKKLKKPRVVALAGVVIFAAAAILETLVFVREVESLRWMYGAGSALLLLGLVHMEDAGLANNLKPRWLCLVGDSSYVLYLIHFPMISLLCKIAIMLGLSGGAGATISFVAIFAICTVASVVVHMWIEKPLLRLLSAKSRLRARSPENGFGLSKKEI